MGLPHFLVYLCLIWSSFDDVAAFNIKSIKGASKLIGFSSFTSFDSNTVTRRKRICKNVHNLKSSIIPISQNKIYDLNLVSREVTAAQWSSYWGANSKERLQRILESLLVAYGGAWFAWFVSFMAGGLAPFVGTLLVFNWLYSPWLNAKRRNDKFWSSQERYGKSKYALYSGKIARMNKLKRRSGKTVGAVKQEYLQVTIVDENDRQLEVITQWQEMYRRLETGMRCDGILVSPSNDFRKLELITDFYVPSCDMFFGDYPYLNKRAFTTFMESMKSTENYENARRKQKSNEKEKNSERSSLMSQRLQRGI